MPDALVNQEVKSITWEAVVIRKDGTREDLGVIARYDRDEPAKNIGQVAFEHLKGLLRRG
jgi:hypothetical protein